MFDGCSVRARTPLNLCELKTCSDYTCYQTGLLLNGADIDTPMGLRNRTILETLYSSGIRRSELVSLTLYEIDTERCALMVRLGKGRKDRLVPLGAHASVWVARYVAEVRPLLWGLSYQVTLFLTDYGEPFEKNRLSDLVERYMRLAGFGEGGCHAFRYTLATHMLENGTDIGFIQMILGHADIPPCRSTSTSPLASSRQCTS